MTTKAVPHPGVVDRVPLPSLLAILGGTGGWLTSHVIGSQSGNEGRPLGLMLTICTAGVSFFLGMVLRRTHRAQLWGLLVGLSVIAAGVVNGSAMGVLIGGPEGVVFGALFGGYCSFAFLMPILLVVGSTRSFGEARRGSVVDQAIRRAPWRTLAAVISVAGLAGGIQIRTPATFMLTATGAAVVISCLVLDLRSYYVLRTIMRRLPTMRSLRSDELRGSATVELGLGDALRAEMWSSATPFRDGEVPTFVVRGDEAAAERVLWRLLVVDVVAASIAVGMVGYVGRYFLC